MPEEFGSLDNFSGGESAQESTAESQERFREKHRKNQAAIKKLKRDEQKKKKQDDTLAHIIVQFLGDKRFTQFFVLISRIVAKNVPSDILLAILALIHKESAQAIGEKKLEIPKDTPPQESSLFPPEIKAHITRWTQNIIAVATAEPHRTLETILDVNWNLDENIVQLAIAVMQQFLMFQKVDIPPQENLLGFCEGFFKTLVANLEKQVHQQTVLAGDIDEDFQ